MNVHFFMDPLGYYTKMFTDRAKRIDPDCLIININHSKIKEDQVISFEMTDQYFWEYVDKLKGVKRIFFHYYNIHFEEVNKYLKKKNPELKSVWCFWSGDFYALPEFVEQQYLEFSRKFIPFGLKYRNNPFRKLMAYFYHRLSARNYYDHNRFIRSFDNIDYFVGIFESDYQNVVNYSHAKMTYIPFAYLSVEQAMGDDLKDAGAIEGNTIMVGHSANMSLNHYEVLKQLEAINSKNEILLPLSYGDERYKKALIEAVKYMKINVFTIDEFMPLDDYNQRIAGVKYAIFNCNIQLAVGNIILLLWRGVKIFIDPRSSVFIDMRKWGMILYPLSEISLDSLSSPLSDHEIQHNRMVLKKHLSEEKVTDYYTNIFNLG